MNVTELSSFGQISYLYILKIYLTHSEFAKLSFLMFRTYYKLKILNWSQGYKSKFTRDENLLVFVHRVYEYWTTSFVSQNALKYSFIKLSNS